jgi:glycosyltransferase involved in cell wall biosynthesis
MRVLAAVIAPPHLHVSGAVNAGIGLSRALARHCDVDIAVMSSAASEERVGEARLLKRPTSNPLAFTEGWLPNKVRTLLYRSDIPDIIHSGAYDLVHLHNLLPTLEMRRIARASRARGVPYVLSTHGFVEFASDGRAYALRLHERAAWKYLIEEPLQEVVRHASMAFATSPVDIEILRRRYSVPLERVRLVTNGVNPFYHDAPHPLEIDHVRRRFALPATRDPHVPICMFLANHTANKGLPVLLDAFTSSERPYVLIVGGQARPEIPYGNWTSRCRPGQRIVITDALTDVEIRALFHRSDLFVLATLADTLPLVILEAMASGLPVLSTRVGGIPFQVDASCGLLVEPGNAAAFRDGFERLTADPVRLEALGEEARRAVRARFDWERSAEAAVAAYRSILLFAATANGQARAPRLSPTADE